MNRLMFWVYPLGNVHSLRTWKWSSRNRWFTHQKYGDFPVRYVSLPVDEQNSKQLEKRPQLTSERTVPRSPAQFKDHTKDLQRPFHRAIPPGVGVHGIGRVSGCFCFFFGRLTIDEVVEDLLVDYKFIMYNLQLTMDNFINYWLKWSFQDPIDGGT